MQNLNASLLRLLIIGFTAGFLAVPLFHQVLLGIFYVLGMVPLAPFQFKPTQPFGVPLVISLSFWGGVWGILFALTIGRFLTNTFYWITSFVCGAIALSAVAGLIVAPLKGMPFAFGWNPSFITLVLLLNGVWGLGTALFFRQMIFKPEIESLEKA